MPSIPGRKWEIWIMIKCNDSFYLKNSNKHRVTSLIVEWLSRFDLVRLTQLGTGNDSSQTTYPIDSRKLCLLNDILTIRARWSILQRSLWMVCFTRGQKDDTQDTLFLEPGKSSSSLRMCKYFYVDPSTKLFIFCSYFLVLRWRGGLGV